jgi:ribosomal protein L11 methylase PrmA
VALPPRGLEPLLLDALRRSGAHEVRRASNRSDSGGVGRVKAVFRTAPPPRHDGGFEEGVEPSTGSGSQAEAEAGLKAEVEARLRAALPSVALSDLAPRWQAFDGAAWLARRGEGRVPLRDGRELRILPGVAFGDGEHPTTRRCVDVLESAVRPGDRWIDIGAGSGILSLAAAACGAREVVAVEMDPAGCDEIRQNFRLNGALLPSVDTISAVCLEVAPGRLGPVEGGAPWDGIVANVEAGVLVPLLPGLGRCVEPGGWVVTSGILASERERIEGAAGAGELGLDRALEDDGWWTLVFRR